MSYLDDLTGKHIKVNGVPYPDRKTLAITATGAVVADNSAGNSTEITLPNPALDTIAAQSVLANPSNAIAAPAAVSVAANRVVGRDGAGNVDDVQVTAAMMAPLAANTVLANATAGSASPTAVAVGADSVLGRQASGNLGGVKVTPDMTAPLIRSYTVTSTTITAGNAFPIVADQTVGTWAAVSSSAQVVPEAGLYEVSFVGSMRVNDTTSGAETAILLQQNAVTVATVGRGARAGTSTAVVCDFASGSYLVRITTPASEALRITADRNILDNVFARVIIRKVAP